ncbi:MAG: hypothetical protein ACE3JK_06465 [Sporolactobacillus sp.]
MTEKKQAKNYTIPKVELQQFRFSPPGSMGWSAADYDEILQKPEIGIETTPSTVPSIETTELNELSVSPDHTTELADLVKDPQTPPVHKKVKLVTMKDKEKQTQTSNTTVKKKKERVTAKKAVLKTNQETAKTAAPKKVNVRKLPAYSGYIVDTHPPAKPWLASFVKGDH